MIFTKDTPALRCPVSRSQAAPDNDEAGVIHVQVFMVELNWCEYFYVVAARTS
jgi:hypothetical protein